MTTMPNPLDRIDVADYRGTRLSDPPDAEALARAVRDARVMVLSVLQTILDRHERHPRDPFLDTKLSVLRGTDYADDDPVAGRDRIYGWIQGRGLEALATHETWLRNSTAVAPALRDDLCKRIRIMLRTVLDAMEALRRANGGRLFFVMTQDGTPLRMGPDGRFVPVAMADDAPSNFSELFYVKGLAAAAAVLDDAAALAAAREWFAVIDRDLTEGRFRSDQQPLDPSNAAIATVPGRHPQGPRMIAIGAAARMLACTGETLYLDAGLAYVDHILDHHVNTDGLVAGGRPYDLWEFVDDAGRPYLEPGGVLRCDPGHACEFVGLALKLLRTAERLGRLTDVAAPRLRRCGDLLPTILERNFANGFHPEGLGIAKAVDLTTGEVIHSDMPWWSLPETIRAALEARAIVEPSRRTVMDAIARRCWNAFVGGYVRPAVHLMAYQTLDRDGRPVDVTPGMPDADPGYHTGLSLIDAIELWEERREA
ncbi:MAG: AGE family epimerase/isomerase [Planctomycetota bacterium]